MDVKCPCLHISTEKNLVSFGRHRVPNFIQNIICALTGPADAYELHAFFFISVQERFCKKKKKFYAYKNKNKKMLVGHGFFKEKMGGGGVFMRKVSL